MNYSDILLIIISSAGLLHGALFALYLMIFKKKKSLTNLLLGLILLCMAFRIGKSVMLNFGDDLEPVFIFVGLTFLTLIGPFYRWYVLGMSRPDFKVTKRHYLELFPFTIIFVSSLFVTREWYNYNRVAFILFASGLIFVYLHLLFYIIISWRSIWRVKNAIPEEKQTKNQKTIFIWLNYLTIGRLLIWMSYVLNILDDAVPYVTGPIVYSVVIYYLSFKAFQLKVLDLNGSTFRINDQDQVFDEISNLIEKDKLYLESDISLARLSKLIGQSPQQTSAIINQYARRNFNDFINFYRIQDAKKLLRSSDKDKFTISSIAFDMGFSSLSSFNSAFKKIEGITPSSYRKGQF